MSANKQQIGYEIDKLIKQRNEIIEIEINNKVAEFSKQLFKQKETLDEAGFHQLLHILALDIKYSTKELK